MDEYRIDSSSIKIYADSSRNNMYLEDPCVGALSLATLSTTSTVDAWNGLTKTNNNIGLGGYLETYTSIDTSYNDIIIGNIQSSSQNNNYIDLEILGNGYLTSSSIDQGSDLYADFQIGNGNITLQGGNWNAGGYVTFIGVYNNDINLYTELDTSRGEIHLSEKGLYYDAEYSSRWDSSLFIPHKGYVDALVTDVSETFNDTFVDVSGDTMTGILNINTDISVGNSIFLSQFNFMPSNYDLQIQRNAAAYDYTTTGGIYANYQKYNFSVDGSKYINIFKDGSSGNGGVIIGGEPFNAVPPSRVNSYGLHVESKTRFSEDIDTSGNLTLGKDLILNKNTFIKDYELEIQGATSEIDYTSIGGIYANYQNYNFKVDSSKYINIFKDENSGNGGVVIGGEPFDAVPPSRVNSYGLHVLRPARFSKNLDVSLNVNVDGSLYIKQKAQYSNELPTIDSSGDITHKHYVDTYGKYSETFDGTNGTSHTVLESTHNLGSGPFHISVYDSSTLVLPNISFNGNGDITVSWDSGSLSSNCLIFITV